VNNARCFFVSLKVGAVYRNLQFFRTYFYDKTSVDPELQLGLGVDINRLLSVSFFTQYIYGQNPKLKTIASQDNYVMRLSSIPKQSGIFLELSIHLDEGFG